MLFLFKRAIFRFHVNFRVCVIYIYIYRRTGRWNAAFENSKENFSRFDRVGPPQMECQTLYRWNVLLSFRHVSEVADGMFSYADGMLSYADGMLANLQMECLHLGGSDTVKT